MKRHFLSTCFYMSMIKQTGRIKTKYKQLVVQMETLALKIQLYVTSLTDTYNCFILNE